ncbi:NAD(P)-binding protein [bacterium]|nr:NAD(P)-binding protein [bacterium]
MKRPDRVAIVGSGITGLCLGQALIHCGVDCRIFDKGRYPGGRMATFFNDGLAIDYGPKWFHTHDEFLESSLRQALVDVGAIVVEPSELPGEVRRRLPTDHSVTSWTIPGGMRALACRLAEPLELRQRHHIRRIERLNEGWRIHGTDESNGSLPFIFDAGATILTMPWPQVADLLRDSGITPATELRLPEITEEAYDRIHVGTFLIEGLSLKPASSGFVELSESTALSRIDRIERPGSPERHIVAAFAKPRWCRKHFDDAPESVMRDLLKEAESQLGETLQATPLRHHRWKFAKLTNPDAGNPHPLIFVDDPPLIVAGEAFGVSSNVSAGILSAQASAAMTFRLLTAGDSGRSGLA